MGQNKSVRTIYIEIIGVVLTRANNIPVVNVFYWMFMMPHVALVLHDMPNMPKPLPS